MKKKNKMKIHLWKTLRPLMKIQQLHSRTQPRTNRKYWLEETESFYLAKKQNVTLDQRPDVDPGGAENMSDTVPWKLHVPYERYLASRKPWSFQCATLI